MVARGGLVPGAGFEPATFGLQNRCTTTVLTRQAVGQARNTRASTAAFYRSQPAPGKPIRAPPGHASAEQLTSRQARPPGPP